MKFSLTVHHGSNFLLVVVTGETRIADLLGAIDFVAAVTRANDYQRVVLDMLTVEIDFTSADHVMLGQRAASSLQHLKRVASVVNERYRVGTSEEAARAGGLLLHTFTNLPEAMEWISQP